MKLGSNDISSVKIGSTDVNKIYIGSTEVWSAANPLLDDYPGAAAAYSLRQLSSTYSGDSIRVRRASDNAESDIGFVSNELDIASLESFCSGTNGFVTTWYDQSGNGYDATQTTSAYQPQIVSSGLTILENGKASIKWDGGTEYLQSNFGVTYSQPNTIFAIANKTEHSAYLFDGINGTQRHAQGNNNWIYAGSVLSDAYPNAYVGSQVSFTTIWNTTNSFAYINASQTATGNVGTQPISGFILGRYFALSSPALNGNIQELILYPSDQSSNRSGIEININNFYNIY